MLKGRLSSEVVNERQQFVNSLKRFVHEQKEKFQQVLDQLKLTTDSLSKVEVKQICPFDQNHSLPEHAFKKHVEKCRLLQAGYQKDELPSQLQNLDVFYEGSQVLKVTVDESLLNKIIWDECAKSGQVYTGHRTMPVSHIDEAVNLTQSDRLAVHNHVVKVSHDAGRVIPVDQSDQLLTTDWGQLVKKGMLNEQSNQQYSSKLEQLAALRDLKRRRQSYRAKNVHITKKSYTEIIREVIVNQMEILAPSKYNSERNDPEEEDNSSRNRKRTHRERDGSRDRDRHRRGRSRERSREKKKDRREKRAREQLSPEKNEKTMDDDNNSKYLEDSLEFNEKLQDIKTEPEEFDSLYSKEQYSPEENQRERSQRRRKESESSMSSYSSDSSYHRRKHKKSKHKKKHSKKHKRKH